MFKPLRVYNLSSFLAVVAYDFAGEGEGLPPDDPPEPERRWWPIAA